VRGDAYAAPAPSGGALLRALERADAGAADAPPPPPAAAAAAPADAAPPVCPSCWGALQHAHAPLDGACAAGAAAAAARRVRGAAAGEGPARVSAANCGAAALAVALAAAGHARAPFALDASLPAALAVLQTAQLAALAADDATATLAAPLRAAPPTPLRDALRDALARPLAAAYGAPHDQAAGPLRAALTYTHPNASSVTAFLRLPAPQHAGAKRNWYDNKGRGGRGGRGGGRGGGGRGWQGDGGSGGGGGASADDDAKEGTPTEVTTAADAAFNAAFRAASALPASELLSAGGVAAPFASPAAPLCAALTVARDALFVGGYYLKQLRGISQSPWLVGGDDVGDGSVQADIEAVIMPLLHADSAKVRQRRRMREMKEE
jgi:uncharacterized membrane protein YgcG